MILWTNSLYASRLDNSFNYIKNTDETAQTEKSEETIQGAGAAAASLKSETSGTTESSFEEDAAVLTISQDGIRRLNSDKDGRVTEKTGLNTVNAETDDSDSAKNVLARIQKYMSRSLQLENEASEDNLSVADKQTIKNEINKITFVVNNLSDSTDANSQVTELMENSIQLYGDLVSHSRENILSNAGEALIAQAQISNMDALALLA